MKGYEVIICNTCNTQFSACVKQHIDMEWKEEVREYTKNGKARLEEVDKCNLDSPVNPCCGDTSSKDTAIMKTAERLFKEMYSGIRENLSLQEICVACMKEYARQCAEQALKDAAERALMIYHCGHFKTDQPTQYHQIGADNLQINKQSILSTPIVTP